MKRKIFLTVILGLITGLSLSFFSHPESKEYLLYHLGLMDTAGLKQKIDNTIREFNQYFAKFFNTAGDLEGLNKIPAAPLIKRRIFQEINQWKKQGKVLVYDRDVYKLLKVDFLSPDTVIAVSKELWFLTIEDLKTRRYISPVKALPIKVRYTLKRDKRYSNGWIVVEYEVFGKDDTIMPIPWRN